MLELPIRETPYRRSSLIDWMPNCSSSLAAAAGVWAAAGCVRRTIRVEYRKEIILFTIVYLLVVSIDGDQYIVYIIIKIST